MIIFIKQNTLIVKIFSIFLRPKKGECLGVAVGNKIHLLGISPEDFVKNRGFLRHEIQHIIQSNTIKFFRLKYLWEAIKVGYKNNKYEIEADNNRNSKIPEDMIFISDNFIKVGPSDIIKF